MLFVTEKLDRVIEYLKQLPPNRYTIEIEKTKSKRSIPQNKLYWSYLRLIQDETGNDIMDLHNYVKEYLLPPKYVTVFLKEVKLPPSTSKLTKMEFSEMIYQLEKVSGIPMPSEWTNAESY